MEAHFQMPCHCHHWNGEQQHQYTNDKPEHYLGNQSQEQLTSKYVFFKTRTHREKDKKKKTSTQPKGLRQHINRQQYHMVGMSYREQNGELAISNHTVRLALNHPLLPECQCHSYAMRVGQYSDGYIFFLDEQRMAQLSGSPVKMWFALPVSMF